LNKSLENKYKFERVIFQLQDDNKLGIVVHTKNIDFINSYINAKDEDFFKQKIFGNFNELFSNNASINELTFNEGISIMKWRASQPSGYAIPLSLQLSRKYRIGFCGDWFEGDGFGRIEGSISTALILERKIKDLIK
jgi:predicted NAD/FAD-dependent oxidoreductase